MSYPPGSLFGNRYRIIRLLQAGGFGEVYEAQRLQARDGEADRVALKLITSTHQDPNWQRRWRLEVMACARLRSPYIVRVHDAGVEDATPWIEMEYLEGETLEARLRSSPAPMPRGEVRQLLDELGAGLGLAHDIGIVHRDLKPGNLFLVGASDGGSMLKVLDFGIAYLMEGDPTVRTVGPLGSPQWMAPEQINAAPQITPATDVWAIGLLGFRLLCGRVYWTTDRHAPYQAWFREAQDSPLAPASQRAASFGLTESLPDGFDAWFARCVHRDPAQRYQHCREAVLALDQILSRATPPADPPPLRQLLRRRSVQVGGVAMATGLGIFYAVPWLPSVPPPPPVALEDMRPTPDIYHSTDLFRGRDLGQPLSPPRPSIVELGLSCKAKHVEACARLEIGCKAKHAEACAELGDVHSGKNREKAADWYNLACQLQGVKARWGCVGLTELAFQQVQSNKSLNDKAVMGWLWSACGIPSSGASGSKIRPPEDAAEAGKRCNDGPQDHHSRPACCLLAGNYYSGIAKPVWEPIHKFWERGCQDGSNAGLIRSCAKLGIRYFDLMLAAKSRAEFWDRRNNALRYLRLAKKDWLGGSYLGCLLAVSEQPAERQEGTRQLLISCPQPPKYAVCVSPQKTCAIPDRFR